MAKTLEDIFVGEFRNAVSNVGNKDIYKIPLPQECNDWEVSGTEEFLVRDATADHYSALNGIVVRKLPKSYLAKRRVIDKATRSFKRDARGEYVYEDVPIPTGSMMVISKRNLKIPYKDYAKRQISVKDPNYGYGYIDFVQKGNSVEYLYILPKTCLYLVHQTALVLSVKNMKNYSGVGYTTWNSGVIYLHVIPYNPNASYVGSRVLKTGVSTSFSTEINKIVDFWQQSGVIPNISLCNTLSGGNLVLKTTAVGYDGYVPVDDLAIGDREIYGSEGDTVNEEQ